MVSHEAADATAEEKAVHERLSVLPGLHAVPERGATPFHLGGSGGCWSGGSHSPGPLQQQQQQQQPSGRGGSSSAGSPSSRCNRLRANSSHLGAVGRSNDAGDASGCGGGGGGFIAQPEIDVVLFGRKSGADSGLYSTTPEKSSAHVVDLMPATGVVKAGRPTGVQVTVALSKCPLQ